MSLSQRFLVAAVLVVMAASVALGFWVGLYVERGITEGVAETAAASIDSLIAHQIDDLTPGAPLTEEERVSLDGVFAIGSGSDAIRLIQIRLRDLEGRTFYESSSELAGVGDPSTQLAAAAGGQVSVRIEQLVLAPVGPIEAFPIDVLEIFTPLHQVETGEIFAVAELYYSARSVLQQRDRAQGDVWLLVGISGLAVIAALYLLVDRASLTIARQRARLGENLAASRRLTEENRTLRVASEDLRQNANFANEALLAQVGSDIHDGPIQLLTLSILRLSRPKPDAANVAASARLVEEAMEELRNISNGLVLPELTALSLAQTLERAISRHENLTGVEVTRELEALPQTVPMVAKICAYRVVQEALSNAYRYGAPEGERVAARIEAGRLTLRISNRPGAGPAPPKTTPGLGLRGMRFRVESLGGSLHVDFAGAAHVVEAEIPLATS